MVLSAALFRLLHLPNVLYGQAVGYTLIYVLGTFCLSVASAGCGGALAARGH